jgi:PAS domain S-box-containing protein
MTKILIADDIGENRCLLASIFKSAGYQVVEARNGSEAQALALKSPPDLIVTDILMPVMDGFELCRRCKADTNLKNVPLVFYAATCTDSKDERFGLSLGAERFISKPQKSEILLQIVRQVLEQTRPKPSAVPDKPLGDETDVLRRYNEVLFHKLETKVTQLRAEIAERERTQEALRESQERLIEAHRLAHIGIWTWERETDRVTWSDELYQVAGLDPGKPAPGYRDIPRLFAPDSCARLQTAIDHALETGTPYQLELELTRPDGTRRSVTSSGGVKRDSSGAVIGLYGTLRDITEYRQAEEKLRFSNLLLEAQMEVSIDGMVAVGESGEIIQFNRRFVEMWGIAPEVIASRNEKVVLDAILDKVNNPEDHRAKVKRLYQSRRETSRDELELTDGRTFDLYSAPMFGSSGEYFGRVWCFRDITDSRLAEEARLKLEEQLQLSQKMEAIGSLAGGVAHDFNNLLSVILSRTGFAIDKMEDGDPRKDDLIEVHSAAERAALLTRQLLAFSRKQLLQPVLLNLNQIAAGVESMLRRILGEDIALVQTLAPDLGAVRADPGQIEQVLMNLVVNARDAMPEGGKLSIATSNIYIDEGQAERYLGMPPGPYVQLTVADTGCGMDEQTKSRLFIPFFTTKEKGRGTGLGLSTVYGIITQSGGDIWVDSEPGRGTIFTIYLPREPEETAAVGVSKTITLATGTETILVVEDEEALRGVFRRCLEDAGFTVLTASDGQEALSVSVQHAGDIHLLLTDVVMPHMSGRALAQEFLKIRPHIKIIYMSGYPDDAIVRHGVIDAGTHFISKPFTAIDLNQKVRAVLDGSDDRRTDGHSPTRSRDSGRPPLSSRPSPPDFSSPTRVRDSAKPQPLDQGVPRASCDDVLGRLRDAAITARYDEILELVKRIGDTEPELASALGEQANRFDYQGILSILNQQSAQGVP